MTRARDLAAFVSNADGDIKFDTDTLFIDSSANRVGIGTTTVDSLLHIKGANPEYRIEDNNETGSANVVFRDSARETAKISVASGSSANMQFQTLGSERMRIDDSGNVGIGASSPSAMLDVVSSGTGSETVAEFGNANISNGLIIETNGNLDWGFNATNSRNMTFSTNQTERMRIDNNGIVTKPNQPAFSVGVTANNWTTSTSGTLVPFDSEHVDVGNNFNTSTYKYTIPVAGVYFWSIMINRLTDSRFDLSLYKNGNRIRTLEIRQTNGSSNQWQIESASGVYSFAANDVLDWRISAISAQGSGMIDGVGHTFDNWNMHLIG